MKVVFLGCLRMAVSGYKCQDCTILGDYAFFRIDGQLDNGFSEMTWDGAEIACNFISGGHLASIRNYDEYTVAVGMTTNLNKAGGQAAWIGIYLFFAWFQLSLFCAGNSLCHSAEY